MSRAVVCALLTAGIASAAACGVPRTVVGPFVKNVTRIGDSLRIVSCEIVLHGDKLEEGRCTSEHIPLTTDAPAPGPPGVTPTSGPGPATGP